jgi:hypothetical protein
MKKEFNNEDIEIIKEGFCAKLLKNTKIGQDNNVLTIGENGEVVSLTKEEIEKFAKLQQLDLKEINYITGDSEFRLKCERFVENLVEFVINFHRRVK